MPLAGLPQPCHGLVGQLVSAASLEVCTLLDRTRAPTMSAVPPRWATSGWKMEDHAMVVPVVECAGLMSVAKVSKTG